MSHNLVFYGNQTLSSVAERVENIDDSIISVINEMFDIMYKEKGVGLAAPQINLGRRIIVIDTGEERNSTKIALINPEITAFSDKVEPYEEGCLSLPRIWQDVIRPVEVTVKGINTKGEEVKLNAGGFFARVLQHEVDHLNGILFIDRIEKYLKDELRTELKKIKKLNKK